MSARLIDGKAAAATLREHLAAEVAALPAEARRPGLAVVLVGDDPASQVYVQSKGVATRKAGMLSFEHRLPADTTLETLLALVAHLNVDEAVDGILVQLPLPPHLSAREVILSIDPAKDVDGLHPFNVGLLAIGEAAHVPCTPKGCMKLIAAQAASLSGMEAVVVGRSALVGKPLAQLLLAADCTVTIAHSRTRDLPEVCRRADILVAAVGRPGLVKGDWVKPGAIVIDVGINRVALPDAGSRLVGDVEFEAAAELASAITPVPGGVGPMTIACLLENTLDAYRRRGS